MRVKTWSGTGRGRTPLASRGDAGRGVFAPLQPPVHDRDQGNSGAGPRRRGRCSPNFSKEKREAIVTDYLEGMPLKLICRKHSCSTSYPGTAASRMGHPTRERSSWFVLHAKWLSLMEVRYANS